MSLYTLNNYVMTGFKGDVGSMLYDKLTSGGHNVYRYGEEFETADVLLHLAAKSPPAESSELIESNISYLKQVISYCTDRGISRVIFTSAMSVYGNPDQENVDEDTPYYAPSLYGISKCIGEKLFEDSDLDVISLRLPAVLGLRNSTNLFARIYDKLRKREKIKLTNSDKVFNNLLSVDSLAEFIMSNYEFSGYDVVNLASAKDSSLFKLVEVMSEVLDIEADVEISEELVPFFNISTSKAEEKYNFQPQSSSESLAAWTEMKLKYL